MTAKPATASELHDAAEKIAGDAPLVHRPTVVQALAAVMADVQAVGKEGHNSSQNYNFRGIDGVMNAVGPALRSHGVVIIPTLLESNYRDVEVGRNRTLMREVTVTVRYTVHGPAGDTLEGVVVGESMDSGDKGTAKAFSVAYRTFLLQALTIPTHQPDPDEQTYERSEAPEPEGEPLWNKLQAKNRLLVLAEGDEALAVKAWEAIGDKTAQPHGDTSAWVQSTLDAAYLAWVNEDPSGPDSGETA